MKELITAYLAAKKAECAANKERIKAEEAILAAVAPEDIPTEGSTTIGTEGYKLTITQRISRKLDEKAYAMIAESIPERLRPVNYVEVAKIDDAGCRWLRDNEPGLWQVLSAAITEKPARIGVKVTEEKGDK